ncbi:crustacean hematopoietic factor-like protein [Penaeus vannamei]|uniref:Crustacean hematopoietic factor-like protein n=1 Tax=Penaeus vannamei TaxID=6689 RepID=A0A423TPW0_PENVA|nr:single insulin-like growth factor-binding domain protein-2 [Penaeus vannamei]ROT78501.1 crustacean hematopoietic factor-like protein [Penaeus vannamei]
MKTALCLALCLACCLIRTESLSCVPGGQGCTPEKEDELKCRNGTVVGPCNGCECAKDRGEECGGPWGFLGQCASGLTCRRDGPHFQFRGKCY